MARRDTRRIGRPIPHTSAIDGPSGREVTTPIETATPARKRRRTGWRRLTRPRNAVVLTLLAALAAGGTYALAQPGSGTGNYRTAAATLGTVTQSVGLSGNLVATNSQNLDFGVSGKVAAVNTSVGRSVKAGDVLATLDTFDLNTAVTQAEANLSSAQARLSLDQSGPTAQQLQQAQGQIDTSTLQVNTAQTNVSDTKTANDQAIAQAKQAVANAQNTLDADEAKQQNDTQQRQSDCSADSTSAACQQDNQTLSSDQQTVAKDKTDLQQAQNGLTDAETKATAAEHQAQAQLDAAQLQLANAEASMTALKGSTMTQQIQIDQNQVTLAQSAVATANHNLSQAKIVAPVDGIVAQVNIVDGQSASGGGSNASSTSSSSTSSSSSSASSSSPAHSIVVLTPGAFSVTGSVSDAQVNQITAGQRALVTPSGSQQAVTGHVTSVSPQATVTSGVSTFPVTINLDGSNPSLKAGTTTTVSVVVDQVVDVLTVPTSAVRTTANGSTVQVLVKGVSQQRSVTTGAADANRTQIVSGLNAGDQVVIAAVSSSPSSATGGQGGLLLGNRPGGGTGGAGGGGAGRTGTTGGTAGGQGGN